MINARLILAYGISAIKCGANSEVLIVECAKLGDKNQRRRRCRIQICAGTLDAPHLITIPEVIEIIKRADFGTSDEGPELVCVFSIADKSAATAAPVKTNVDRAFAQNSSFFIGHSSNEFMFSQMIE